MELGHRMETFWICIITGRTDRVTRRDWTEGRRAVYVSMLHLCAGLGKESLCHPQGLRGGSEYRGMG